MLKQRQSGFTIVELLIVIVVIGILAAVAIVAYNGVQTRAENAKTTNGIAVFMKSMELYKTYFSTYPVNASYPCIGEIPTQCGVATVSSGCWGIGSVPATSAFNTEIQKVVSKVPTVSKQSMTCNTDGSKASGAFVLVADTWYSIYYFLRGDVACGSPTGIIFSRSFSVDTTLCSASIT